MGRVLNVQAVVLGLVLAACGDNAVMPDGAPATFACQRDDREDPYCVNSAIVASRTATTYVPEQHDVWAIYDALRPAFFEEPVLRNLRANPERSYSAFEPYSFYSSHAPLVVPWTSGTVATGDPVLDALFIDRGASVASCEALPEEPETSLCSVTFPFVTSWRILEEEIAAIADTIIDLEAYPRSNDIVLESLDGSDATFGLTVGWGDCQSDCIYYHSWRWTVTGFGERPQGTLEDLGGDEIVDAAREGALRIPAPR